MNEYFLLRLFNASISLHTGFSYVWIFLREMYKLNLKNFETLVAH